MGQTALSPEAQDLCNGHLTVTEDRNRRLTEPASDFPWKESKQTGRNTLLGLRRKPA